MKVLVLGSGAGGGVPQWNCRCGICALAWNGSGQVSHRTQTSVALSADGVFWVVLDAAPDLRQQIIATPALHPRGLTRGSPVVAVVLTSGEVDHLTGLLCLREGHAFALYGTRTTLGHVAASPLFSVLQPDIVTRHTLALESAVAIAGLSITAFSVPGKVPLYREGATVSVGDENEDVVGLAVSDGRSTLAYVPGIAHLTPSLRDRFATMDLLLLDGTTFTDDELVTGGLSAKTAGRMGHLAMSGPDGSMGAFSAEGPVRRCYLHMNNSNPVLIEDSPERMAVVNAGWIVAHDGMEFTL